MEKFLRNLFLTIPVLISIMMIQHFVLYNIYQNDHQLPLLHSAFVASTFVQCFSPSQNDCEYVMNIIISQLASSFTLFILGYLVKSFLLLLINSVAIIVIDVILTIVVFFQCLAMLVEYLEEPRTVF